jgi:hypothetical protein
MADPGASQERPNGEAGEDKGRACAGPAAPDALCLPASAEQLQIKNPQKWIDLCA